MITEDLENELRRAFARAGAGIEVPDAARTRLSGRNYHPRRLHRGAAGTIGAVALAAAAGIAIPLGGIAVPPGGGGGSAPFASGARIRLDSYTFTMPAGYRAVGKVHHRWPCPLAIGMHVPPTSSSKAGVAGIGLPKVPPQMQTAASADGGCVGLMLSPAYRPVPGSTDPFAFAGSRPVRVGDHHGLLYYVLAYGLGPDGKMVRLRPGMFDLFVPLPSRGGKVRDLVIGSNKLTKRQLIAIAVSGLSSRS
jgi:hypothetical protein